MQILQEIAGNGGGMLWYQICSLCIGIILIFCINEQRVWYKMSVYSVCVVNAFLWGSMLLFRLYFNQLSFLIGGILGIVLTLLLFAIKKGGDRYLLCFWCQVKVFLVAGNYVMEHDWEEQEEKIFGTAISIATFLFVLLLLIAAFYQLEKRKSMNIKGICKVFGLIYGSVIVTGCIYEFVYGVVVRNTKFLSVNADYINFYKALLKVDWTEDGREIFFAAMCVGIIIFGAVYQGCFRSQE